MACDEKGVDRAHFSHPLQVHTINMKMTEKCPVDGLICTGQRRLFVLQADLYYNLNRLEEFSEDLPKWPQILVEVSENRDSLTDLPKWPQILVEVSEKRDSLTDLPKWPQILVEVSQKGTV